MVEKNAAAHAKLELLSNTAMLKKVLDRGIETKGKADDKAPQTNGGRDVSCIVSVPSPTPSDLRNQRGERTPSPQGVADTREAPPVPANRPVYIPAPIPAPAPAHAHYTYINEIEQHRTLSNRSAFVDARPRYAVPPTMIVTGHGDAYYYDHHRNASSMAGSSSHRHHPHQVSHIHGGASGNGTTTTMGPYHVQENVPPPPPPPPCAYMHPTTYSEHHTIDTHRQGSAPETIYFHHHHHIRSTPSDDHDDPRKSSYETLARENFQMREQLREKDMVVSSLQQRVNHLEKQISELRQLPTGKISHIPIDDMVRIMEEYGSEVSNQTLPKRKDNIKKASVVRQFRRWNPEFFRYFIHVNGEWVPKLGKEGELKRRAEKRCELKRNHGKA